MRLRHAKKRCRGSGRWRRGAPISFVNVLETHFGQDLPATSVSAGQLRQIVMNLITNAADAIADRDGVIRVITNPRATDLAWPSYRELCAVSAARSIWRANRTRGL